MFKDITHFAIPAASWHFGTMAAKALDSGAADNIDTTQRSSSSSPSRLPFSKVLADEKGKKRLIICCDGTWKNAAGTVLPPTNVARLARSVDRHGYERWGGEENVLPVPQIAYYASGVGTDSVLPVPIDYLYSGVTGQGLEKTILNAYCFLSNNYNFVGDEDEIILVGFSRGAFAVRCLAAFIDEVGLFRRKYLSLLPLVFENWVEGNGKVDPKIKQALYEDDAIIDVPILALAEWDTVSSLWDSRLSFVRGTVPSSVENAFMAIAIDERRWSFQPMLWTRQANSATTRVEQCLFAGHHGDIGGGNIDTGLSTIALLWMMSQIEDVSNASFESGALLQSIVPILPKSLSTEKLSTGQPAHVLRYEGLLRSKGQVNHPPWWWSIPHKLSFGMFSGDRDRCVGEVVGSGRGLGNEIKVHFTVPLLAKETMKSHGNPNGSQDIEVWNGLNFQISTPTENEIRLWKAWSKLAAEWNPDSQRGKTDEMKRWGSVLEKLGMKPIDGSGKDPVVHRVLKEMKSKWPALHQRFSEQEEDQGGLEEGESRDSTDSPKPQ